MINNSQTVNIDGSGIDRETLEKVFTFDKTDPFNRWVLRPLALLAIIGTGVAVFLASAFLIILSLAMTPLIALSLWAIRKKVERDIAVADPVVATQERAPDEPVETGRLAT